MSILAFAFRVSCIGLAIPILWIAVYKVKPEWIYYLLDPIWMNHVVLLIWPSSLMLLADPEETTVSIPVVSTLINGLLYFTVTVLLVYGFRRNLAVFWSTIIACFALAIFLVRI